MAWDFVLGKVLAAGLDSASGTALDWLLGKVLAAELDSAWEMALGVVIA